MRESGRSSFSRKIFMIINTLLMIFISVACLYPMLYVVFASVSDANLLIQHSGVLLKPAGFNLGAYKSVWSNPMIMSGYRNIIIVLLIGVPLNIILTSMGAYFLSRKNAAFKSFVMKFITVTMFFNGGMIPFYMTVKHLGLYNNIFSLIFPVAINTFNLIIMRTSFESIPVSLEEAALIDGAGHFTVLAKVIIPLSKSIIAVMVLFYAVNHWNSWFNAMIFLSDRERYPLQLVLYEILIQNDTKSMTSGAGIDDAIQLARTVKYAVIVVSTVPILCIYPFLQKYFTKGVMIGAVKG